MKAVEPWLAIYFLNSLWQVPLLWLTAQLAARLLRGFRPVWAHRVWVGALILEIGLPGLSARTWPSLTKLALWLMHPSHSGRVEVTVAMGPAHPLWGTQLSSPWVHACSTLMGGLLVTFSVRLLWRYGKTLQLARSSEPVVLQSDAERAWRRCCAWFRVRDVPLVQSRAIRAPLTLGWLRKRVLVPEGWLTSLNDADLLAVFAHECAHMQRDDFARNLLYQVLALPITYHPLCALTQARVVESREWICDALAAEVESSTRGYARSLLRLAARSLETPQAQVSHAIGILDANAFERRVMNLVEGTNELNGARRVAMLALCMVVGVAGCGSAWALGAKVPSLAIQSEPGTAAAETAPVQIASKFMAGNVLSRVAPVYPQEAKDAGVEGEVVLSAVIGTDGSIEELKVVSGPPELTRSAFQAVSQWVYKPYLLNGEPTRVETTIHVNYHLQS